MDKETPITKYLATLERRQAQRERDNLFSVSPRYSSPEVSPRPTVNIRQQLRFEDETFMEEHDQGQGAGILPFSPAPQQGSHSHSQSTRGQGQGHSSIFQKPFLPGDRDRDTSVAILSPQGLKRKRSIFDDREEEEDRIKKICELEKLLRQTNGDLVEARALTAKLEKQKMDLRTECYEKALNSDRTLSEMRIKCRDALEKAEVLQKDSDLKDLKLAEVKEELRLKSTQNIEKLRSLETRVSELERENATLKQNVEEDKMNQSSSLLQLNTSLSESSRGVEKQERECTALREQLALKDAQITKLLSDLKDAEIRAYRAKPATAEADETDSSGERDPASTLEEVKKYENLFISEQSEKRKMASVIAKLSEENGYLKGAMKKELLLEEQVASLENEVKYLRDLSQTKASLEVENDLLKKELEEWKEVATNFDSGLNSVHNFTLFLSKMQTDLVQLKHENTTISCRLDSLNRDVSRLQTDLKISKQNEAKKNEECDKMQGEVKQLTRRLTLMTKDRDGLKALKESYEQELSEIIATGLKARVDELEGLLLEYEQALNDTSTTINTTNTGSGKSNCSECDKRIALISSLRSELENVKRSLADANYSSVSMLGDVTGTLGGFSGSGDTTKIVTFGNNPSSIKMEARVKELISENEKLKNRIKYLENLDQAGGNNDTLIAAGNQALEEQIRTLERKNQLLSDAYDYETQQLQMALSKLFGFHIILVREPQSQFRLQSVYGVGGQEDELIFQEAENSDMMLLESPVLDNFRDDIERFLIGEGSIPAFLATVTIAFSQGLVQQGNSSTLTSSQVPFSQPSGSQSQSQDDTTSVTINPVPSRKMVEVEVEGQSDDEEEEDEEQGEEEEEPMEDEEDEQDEEQGEEEEEEYSEEEQEGIQGQQEEDSDSDVVCIESD